LNFCTMSLLNNGRARHDIPAEYGFSDLDVLE
jgi:hypothetical protein